MVLNNTIDIDLILPNKYAINLTLEQLPNYK